MRRIPNLDPMFHVPVNQLHLSLSRLTALINLANFPDDLGVPEGNLY
jgi:hypothetical protein